jgi:hypothetical protein
MALSSSYTIGAPDLRGYGSSSMSKGSESHIEHPKKIMSRDCALVMAARGVVVSTTTMCAAIIEEHEWHINSLSTILGMS